MTFSDRLAGRVNATGMALWLAGVAVFFVVGMDTVTVAVFVASMTLVLGSHALRRHARRDAETANR